MPAEFMVKKMNTIHGLELSEWAPTKWCVAAQILCTAFEAEGERYPEQWVYFLWRPGGKAVPYRDPDCVGYAVGDPFDQINDTIGKEPMYVLQEDECHWPALLELTLTVDDLEDWIAGLVRKLLEEKKRNVHDRWRHKYADEPETDNVLPAKQPELPDIIVVDETGFDADCACLTGLQPIPLYRDVGTDVVNSSYGEVDIVLCGDCGRHWLRFFIEFEAFSRSGRWYLGRIESPYLDQMTPELAIPYLSKLDWFIRGGSFYDGKVSRSRGRPGV